MKKGKEEAAGPVAPTSGWCGSSNRMALPVAIYTYVWIDIKAFRLKITASPSPPQLSQNP